LEELKRKQEAVETNRLKGNRKATKVHPSPNTLVSTTTDGQLHR